MPRPASPLPLSPARLLLAADTWERHVVAAALLGLAGGGRPAVLDVGGTPGTLARFLPRGCVVTVANVRPPADVVWDGGPLPFADGAFTAATSLDVLEHLPSAARAGHLAELVRVARGAVVLCCPAGTPEHVASERVLHARRPHPFLAEHLQHGLPTAEELLALAAALPGSWQLLAHGDLRRAAWRHLHPRAARLDPRRDTATRPAAGAAGTLAAANRLFLVGRR